jgi:hypothetical protein
VSVPEHPPAVAGQVILPVNECIQIAACLELPKAVHFESEFRVALQGEVNVVRPDFMLGPKGLKSLWFQEWSQDAFDELDLEEVVSGSVILLIVKCVREAAV